MGKSGALLKRRRLPLAPWSQRSFELSGTTLVYAYPESNLQRHYYVSPAWRVEAGRGDIFHLRAVDRRGRNEDMTLRPLGTGDRVAERNDWVAAFRAAIAESQVNVEAGTDIAVTVQGDNTTSPRTELLSQLEQALRSNQQLASDSINTLERELQEERRARAAAEDATHLAQDRAAKAEAAVARAVAKAEAMEETGMAVTSQALAERERVVDKERAQAKRKEDELEKALADVCAERDAAIREAGELHATLLEVSTAASGREAALEREVQAERTLVAEQADIAAAELQTMLHDAHRVEVEAAWRERDEMENALTLAKQKVVELQDHASARAEAAVDVSRAVAAAASEEASRMEVERLECELENVHTQLAASRTATDEARAEIDVRREQVKLANAQRDTATANVQALRATVTNVKQEAQVAQEKVLAIELELESAEQRHSVAINDAVCQANEKARAQIIQLGSLLEEARAATVCAKQQQAEDREAGDTSTSEYKQHETASSRAAQLSERVSELECKLTVLHTQLMDAQAKNVVLQNRVVGADAIARLATASHRCRVAQARAAEKAAQTTMRDALSQLLVGRNAEVQFGTPAGNTDGTQSLADSRAQAWDTSDSDIGAAISRSGIRHELELEGELVRVRVVAGADGLGLHLAAKDSHGGLVHVRKVDDTSPLSSSVKRGDILVAVNGRAVLESGLAKIVSLLQVALNADFAPVDVAFVRGIAAQMAHNTRARDHGLKNDVDLDTCSGRLRSDIQRMRRQIIRAQRTDERLMRQIMTQARLAKCAVGALKQQLPQSKRQQKQHRLTPTRSPKAAASTTRRARARPR
eukprot:g3.t1